MHALPVLAASLPCLTYQSELMIKKPGKIDPYHVFSSAVIVRNWEIAGSAITAFHRNFTWKRPATRESEIDRALGCIWGTSDLDPMGMPYHFWLMLPKKVSWALLRCCSEKTDWESRGKKFTELMSLIERELTGFANAQTV